MVPSCTTAKAVPTRRTAQWRSSLDHFRQHHSPAVSRQRRFQGMIAVAMCSLKSSALQSGSADWT